MNVITDNCFGSAQPEIEFRELKVLFVHRDSEPLLSGLGHHLILPLPLIVPIAEVIRRIHGVTKLPENKIQLLFEGFELNPEDDMPTEAFESFSVPEEDEDIFRPRVFLRLKKVDGDIMEQLARQEEEERLAAEREALIRELEQAKEKERQERLKNKMKLAELRKVEDAVAEDATFELEKELEQIECDQYYNALKDAGYADIGAFSTLSTRILQENHIHVPRKYRVRLLALAEVITSRLERSGISLLDTLNEEALHKGAQKKPKPKNVLPGYDSVDRAMKKRLALNPDGLENPLKTSNTQLTANGSRIQSELTSDTEGSSTNGHVSQIQAVESLTLDSAGVGAVSQSSQDSLTSSRPPIDPNMMTRKQQKEMYKKKYKRDRNKEKMTKDPRDREKVHGLQGRLDDNIKVIPPDVDVHFQQKLRNMAHKVESRVAAIAEEEEQRELARMSRSRSPRTPRSSRTPRSHMSIQSSQVNQISLESSISSNQKDNKDSDSLGTYKASPPKGNITFRTNTHTHVTTGRKSAATTSRRPFSRETIATTIEHALASQKQLGADTLLPYDVEQTLEQIRSGAQEVGAPRNHSKALQDLIDKVRWKNAMDDCNLPVNHYPSCPPKICCARHLQETDAQRADFVQKRRNENESELWVNITALDHLQTGFLSRSALKAIFAQQVVICRHTARVQDADIEALLDRCVMLPERQTISRDWGLLGGFFDGGTGRWDGNYGLCYTNLVGMDEDAVDYSQTSDLLTMWSASMTNSLGSLDQAGSQSLSQVEGTVLGEIPNTANPNDALQQASSAEAQVGEAAFSPRVSKMTLPKVAIPTNATSSDDPATDAPSAQHHRPQQIMSQSSVATSRVEETARKNRRVSRGNSMVNHAFLDTHGVTASLSTNGADGPLSPRDRFMLNNNSEAHRRRSMRGSMRPSVLAKTAGFSREVTAIIAKATGMCTEEDYIRMMGGGPRASLMRVPGRKDVPRRGSMTTPGLQSVYNPLKDRLEGPAGDDDDDEEDVKIYNRLVDMHGELAARTATGGLPIALYDSGTFVRLATDFLAELDYKVILENS